MLNFEDSSRFWLYLRYSPLYLYSLLHIASFKKNLYLQLRVDHCSYIIYFICIFTHCYFLRISQKFERLFKAETNVGVFQNIIIKIDQVFFCSSAKFESSNTDVQYRQILMFCQYNFWFHVTKKIVLRKFRGLLPLLNDLHVFFYLKLLENNLSFDFVKTVCQMTALILPFAIILQVFSSDTN